VQFHHKIRFVFGPTFPAQFPLASGAFVVKVRAAISAAGSGGFFLLTEATINT
jgi:hypothetical protein